MGQAMGIPPEPRAPEGRRAHLDPDLYAECKEHLVRD